MYWPEIAYSELLTHTSVKIRTNQGPVSSPSCLVLNGVDGGGSVSGKPHNGIIEPLINFHRRNKGCGWLWERWSLHTDR